jgi:aspartate carbamoyltransferase catalytic subunit
MGAEVFLIAPPTMMPLGVRALGGVPVPELDAMLGLLDVVYLLRLQRERHREPLLPSEHEFWADYGLTRERLAKMKDGAVVMHPGPMNRGVEIDWETAESDVSLVEAQVSAGVAVRMALMYTLLGGSPATQVAS